eukprot:PhF_6_TR6816/c0_g1_i1/m.9807
MHASPPRSSSRLEPIDPKTISHLPPPPTRSDLTHKSPPALPPSHTGFNPRSDTVGGHSSPGRSRLADPLDHRPIPHLDTDVLNEAIPMATGSAGATPPNPLDAHHHLKPLAPITPDKKP